MRTSVARIGRVAVSVVLTVAAAGCSPIQVVTSPLVTGSQWHVVSVDDESTVGLELILTFIGDSATLSSRCGASIGDVDVEAKGHAVTFGAQEGPAGQPICPAEALELHQRVADALQDVERWESAGSNTELHGERIIRLRPQATDT
jgi:hypothetical protein